MGATFSLLVNLERSHVQFPSRFKRRRITYKCFRLFYLYYAQYNKQSSNVFQALPHKLSSATYGYFFGLKIQAKRAKLFHNSRSGK